MDSSVSPKDEILFLRVSHHISTGLYLYEEQREIWCAHVGRMEVTFMTALVVPNTFNAHVEGIHTNILVYQSL